MRGRDGDAAGPGLSHTESHVREHVPRLYGIYYTVYGSPYRHNTAVILPAKDTAEAQLIWK